MKPLRRRVVLDLTGWAPYGTLEDTLRASSPAYAIDLRSASAGQDSLAFHLRAPMWTRSYPDRWAITRKGFPSAWSNFVPATAFDALVHVRYVAIWR